MSFGLEVFKNISADATYASSTGAVNYTDPFQGIDNADTDGDGVGDNSDAFPNNAAETADTDGDGVGNNADTDDDGDGVFDTNDALPLDSSETIVPHFSSSEINQNKFGGTSQFTVIVGVDRLWKAISNVPWLEIINTDFQNGSQTVEYKITPNLASEKRKGEIDIISNVSNLTEWATSYTHYLAGHTSLCVRKNVNDYGDVYFCHAIERTGVPTVQLRLISRKKESKGWNVETIDEGLFFDYEIIECSINNESVIGIVYSDSLGKNTKFAYKKSDGWIYENITDEEGIGISLSKTQEGNPAAVFLKGGDLVLSYRNNNNEWISEKIDGIPQDYYRNDDRLHDIQKGASISFSPSNIPYVAYSRSPGEGLIIASKNNNKWNYEIIDEGHTTFEHLTAAPSIGFNIDGQPSVAYYAKDFEADISFLKYAEKKSDEWSISEVDSLYSKWRYRKSRCKLNFNNRGNPVIISQVLRSQTGDGFMNIARFEGAKWNSEYLGEGGRSLDFDMLKLSGNSPEKIILAHLSGPQGVHPTLRIKEQVVEYAKEDANILSDLVKYKIPVNSSLGNDWTKPIGEFDDSHWFFAEQPVGYESDDGVFDFFIKTNIKTQMLNKSSAYFRSTFELSPSENIDDLSLDMKCDDGCLIYLNGNKIVNLNMPDLVDWNSLATATKLDHLVLEEPIIIEFNQIKDFLREGPNVIAIHLANVSKTSSDLFIECRIKRKIPVITEKKIGALKVTQSNSIQIDNDTDGDSFTDQIEIEYGSDPKSIESFPHSVEPVMTKVSPLGDKYEITISSPQDIIWNIETSAPWIKIIGQIDGMGEGRINYSVDRNNSNQFRRTQIKIINSAANEPRKIAVHFIEQNPIGILDDTDGDGLKDIVETNTGVFQSMEDTGTDPLKIDSDNDGVSDSSELGLDRFSLVVGSRNWGEAFDDAILKGGNLGTFTTEHEMDNALSSVDFNSLGEFRGVWIGATDAEEEGNWKWVTGEDLELGRWAANHPDNFLEADVAEIGAGLSNEPGKIFDVPESVSRDAYLLEVGYPSNPLNPDTDGDGFTDGEEARASTRPDDADDKPKPSPILDDIEISISESERNKELILLNPSHPNGDEVTIELFDNPDVDQDGVGAFGIENNKLQINDFDDFDFELQTSLQLTLRLRSDKAIPLDSLVTIQLIDDRDEDFDGDGIIESVEEDVHGTSDTSVDSDNDGLSDAFEIGYGRFEIVKGIFSWSAAISDAGSRGGHLATFPSQSKWDVAIDSLGDRPFQNFNSIWIGLSNEGEWSWVDGSDLTYERWGLAQPTRYTRAIVSGAARGRTAGAWYALRINSNADGYFLELGYPTDPSRADTDNDGVNDKDETDSGTNPVVADDFFVDDNDRDGWKDEAERLFGSNPEDSESVPDFQLQVEVNDSNEIELLFPGEKGASYEVQVSENLEEWLSLEGLILGSGATIRQVVPMRDNFPFYRIKRK